MISQYLIINVLVVVAVTGIILLWLDRLFSDTRKTSKTQQASDDEGLRLFTEMAYVGVALLEIKTLKFTRVNSKFCTLTGYSEAELLDRIYIEIIPEADIPSDQASIEAVISGDKDSFQSRKQFTRKDKTPIWISIHRQILRDKQMNIRFLMLEIIDVTAEKEISLALKKNELLFRTAIESYPYTFVIYNENRQVEFINKNGINSFGVPLAQLIGKQAEEIDLWQTTQSLPLLLKVYETKQPQKAELSFIQDKKELYYMVNYVPILGEETQIWQVFGIMQDVTAERLLEQFQLRKRDVTISDQGIEAITKQHELDDSRRLSNIGGLAATVAHELRNPLGVIRTAAYNLRRKNKEPNLVSHLDNIDKKVIESDRIISNLLNYARLKTPHFEKINIGELLEETIETVQKQYADYPIKLTSNLKELNIVLIDADPIQLNEVFVNLIENAYQAIGNKPCNIEVTMASKDDHIIINVRDEGPGINSDDLSQIFVPFFTRKPKGTGLGLPICLELIRLHNGDLTVKSVENEGCLFSVSLPISQYHE